MTAPASWSAGVPFPRATYEGGGWSDGRLGQAYDLIAAVIEDRGEKSFGHPLLSEIEAMDAERAIA